MSSEKLKVSLQSATDAENFKAEGDFVIVFVAMNEEDGVRTRAAIVGELPTTVILDSLSDLLGELVAEIGKDTEDCSEMLAYIIMRASQLVGKKLEKVETRA